MEAVYERKQIIAPSMCDASGRIGLSAAFALFQDVASEHAEELGVGFQDMARRGAFWLTVRTRVRFYRRPALMQAVDVRTWPAAPGSTRCDRFYRMSDQGQTLIEGRTEWCVYDLAAKAVRPLAEAGFREGLVYSDAKALDAPYARFRHDFTDGDRVAGYAVRPSDVDVGRHMNNVAYLRLLADSFSVEEMERMRVQEMEILFCMPCFEGEELDVLRRRTQTGYEFGVRRPDGRYAALALMRMEEETRVRSVLD